MAVWEYSEASVAYIFGDALGDETADTITRRALRAAGPAGLTRSLISDLFNRNRSQGQISAALGLLMTHRRARCETRPSGSQGGAADGSMVSALRIVGGAGGLWL